jgi:hypothetical protein
VLTLGIVPVVYSLLDGIRSRYWHKVSDTAPAEATSPHARAVNE